MKKFEVVYIGRRLNRAGTAMIWGYQFKGEENPRFYKGQLFPATIGEAWMVTELDGEKGSIQRRGEHEPKRFDVLAASQPEIDRWEALEAAHEQELRQRKADRKLAARKSEFEKCMEPLERMYDSLKSVSDQHYFLQAVTRQLMRRRVP